MQWKIVLLCMLKSIGIAFGIVFLIYLYYVFYMYFREKKDKVTIFLNKKEIVRLVSMIVCFIGACCFIISLFF